MPILTTVKCAWYAMIARVHTRTLAYAGHQKKTDTHTTRKETTMTTSTLDGNGGLARQEVVVNQPAPMQQVAGWITSTQTSSGEQIFYGFFATIEQAQEWAKNLITGTTIEAVYHPSHNAG